MIVRKNENYGVSGSIGEQDYDRVIYGGFDGTYIKTSDYENDKNFQRRQIKSLEFRNKILSITVVSLFCVSILLSVILNLTTSKSIFSYNNDDGMNNGIKKRLDRLENFVGKLSGDAY